MWLMCSAVCAWVLPKQQDVQKEEVKEDVACRGQNVVLESESSRFKYRLKQLKVSKQFTHTLLASVFSIPDYSKDCVNVHIITEEHW